MAYYKEIVPSIPPANEPSVCGEWWGCKDWMVRAGMPPFAEEETIHTLSVPPPALVLAKTGGPSAADARLGPARWSRHGDGHPVVCVPVGAADGYAVNPLYLDYASAIADVEEWRWLPTDELRHPDMPMAGAGVLVGLRDGEVVAVVCPLIWSKVSIDNAAAGAA